MKRPLLISLLCLACLSAGAFGASDDPEGLGGTGVRPGDEDGIGGTGMSRERPELPERPELLERPDFDAIGDDVFTDSATESPEFPDEVDDATGGMDDPAPPD